MKSPTKNCFISLFAGLAIVLTGCASVSVKNMDAVTTPLSKPDVIYVMPFDAPGAEWNVNREGVELADYQRNLEQMLQAALVAEIPEHLVPAQPGGALPKNTNAWVIYGKFVRVNEGSRALRSTIGFGAGGTKLETRVYIYDLANGASYPFLTFETTGGSGAQPGAIMGAATLSPVGAAIGAVSGSARGLTDDTKRTSRMITAALSDYMYFQGWITKEQKLSPKMAE